MKDATHLNVRKMMKRRNGLPDWSRSHTCKERFLSPLAGGEGEHL
jgi:hypothetical protein